MKLSVAWIFDHIDADYKTQDIPRLVDLFNQTTAEIEGFERITISLDQFALARVQSMDAESVRVNIPEWQEEAVLPFREDARDGQWFLIKRTPKGYQWAQPADVGSAKECTIPALHVAEGLHAGAWKQHVETEDYILEVDNKSITHRPDLWGHRGFAREIAAMLNLKLKPFDSFLSDTRVQEYGTAKKAQHDGLIIEHADAPEVKRFAAMRIATITPTPSLFWMVHRLLRVDSKPIDAIVDMTNYVMLDMSQPMHAFDAALITSNTLMPRYAHNNEELILLDGENIKLTDEDLVVTDGKHPIALAGIMGGASTAVSTHTTSLLLESACFDATTIRRSSLHHKKRTEASARFEKSLDPNQNILALRRFIKLLEVDQISFQSDDEIISLGAQLPKNKISISHEFIQKRIGCSLSTEQVRTILEKLDFVVHEENVGTYDIEVPTFRSTKDIRIKEDIVEEVGRFVGYSSMAYVLPEKQTIPTDLAAVNRIRLMKHVCAYVGRMRELYSYALYDESFLDLMRWDSQQTLEVKSPVSENMRRPVTSLVPHLLKAVHENAQEHEQLRFFEWGRAWDYDNNVITERKLLSGIMYAQKDTIDFYTGKKFLHELFDTLSMPVTWHKVNDPAEPWFAPYQTADIMIGDQIIGRAGIAHIGLLHPLVDRGSACIFELNGDALLAYKKPKHLYVPVSKYPEVERDISMMVPRSATVADITQTIKHADSNVVSVSLLDFFAKEEWHDVKSLTFRFTLHDQHKTLTKAEVDQVYDCVVNALRAQGAEIR